MALETATNWPELVANASLTFAGVVVGVGALFVTYRNNFGWSPIVLITGHGMGMQGDMPEHYEIVVMFEIWNRRKYPIVVRHVTLSFDFLEMETGVENFEYDKDWHSSAGAGYKTRMHFSKTLRLEPTSHREFRFGIPFKRRTLDDLRETPKVKVHYFDPRIGKEREAEGAANIAFK